VWCGGEMAGDVGGGRGGGGLEDISREEGSI